MKTFEIIQRVATNHNRIAQVFVSGDNAVLVGETIKDLRLLVQQLQADLETEQQEKKEEGQATKEETEQNEMR